MVEGTHMGMDGVRTHDELLSDMGGDISKEYGVYNPSYKAARRVTYLIDKDGKVVEMQKDRDAIDPTEVVTSCQRRRMKG